MLPIANKPILRYVIEGLAQAGLRHIVLVVGYVSSFFFPPGGKGEWTLWGWLEKRKTLAAQQP